ncbi:MAG: ATP-binding protein, partial [Myxococcales bacterium]
ALVCIPLIEPERAVGVLTLVAPRVEADDAVWLALGEQFAASMHVAELRDAATRRTRDLETALAGLRSLERDRDELLGNASHELKNPLTTVKAYLAMMRKERLGPVSEKQREALEVCDRNADRLLRLINDMLLTSRLQAGRMTLDQKPFGLKGLLDDVVRVSSALAEAAGVSLQLSRGGEIYVKGDRDRMMEALSNLVENAILSNRRGGRVEVRLGAEAGVATVVVHDTGVGIAAADLPRIFDRFYRGQSSLERRTGSGLGLSICRQIVHLHGGSISATSEPDQGSTFSVRLPLFAGAVALASAPQPEQPTVGGSSILIVEDDDDCREVLGQLLETDGFSVVTANALDVALKRLESMQPGLVLLDLRLGGSDGRAVLKHLRNDPRLAQTPVFVISGASESAAGFSWDGPERIDAFYEKPLNLQRLLAHVHRLMRPASEAQA